MVQIVVMARWPSPGRCKRRLSRDLNHELGLANSSERATRIQRRLTQHTAAVVRPQLDRPNAPLRTTICASPVRRGGP